MKQFLMSKHRIYLLGTPYTEINNCCAHQCHIIKACHTARRWQVQHVPDFDYRSTCVTMLACLREVARWSSKAPKHAPVFVHIEFKAS
jgi:hypothetical protein